MIKQFNSIYIIDLIDAIWQYIRLHFPQYKDIQSLYHLYTSKIPTEFNLNYDLPYEEFKKHCYIELTGKRFYKQQKEWFENLIKNIPNISDYHINTIDSAIVKTKYFLQMQMYFIEQDVRCRIYKIEYKIENKYKYTIYAMLFYCKK
jgi:hypothetical protein